MAALQRMDTFGGLVHLSRDTGAWLLTFSIIPKYEIKHEPWFMLFHCSSVSIGRYRSLITPYLLNAAKSLIPLYWRQRTVPTVAQWLQKVDDLCFLEDLTCMARDAADKYSKI